MVWSTLIVLRVLSVYHAIASLHVLMVLGFWLRARDGVAGRAYR